jgi:type IV pilus assembly protein PilM
MASTGLGVTIGSHSLRAVKLRRKGAGFVVQKVFSERVDDATRPAAGRALAARGLTGAPVTLGLTGRDVIIRYSQVPPVPDWRLKTLMKFEVEEVGSQSGGDVSADYKKLNLPDPDGAREEDTILVALARNRHLDVLLKALASGGLKTSGGCPNSVALFNAFAVNATYTEEETAILVNVGAEDLDIAIQRGGELLFARNATPGGKAFTEALRQAFSTSESKAEQMKLTKGDVTPKGQAKYADSTAEKVANAMMGVAGQMSALIQSTLMIARAQTRIPDLRIDRVLLAGGGASLKGLDLYLKQAMGVPVERFNPFVLCDLSQLSAEEKELAEKAPHEFAVCVGLAQTRLSNAAFQLEVLPAALRRQRDFWTKGIWSVAAAAVMGGVLWFLYQGRIEAAAEHDQRRARVIQRTEAVKKRDTKVREQLARAQEEEIRHGLLAERITPGRVLADVWSVLNKQLALSPNVYLVSVGLRLEESANEFPYVRPKKPQYPGTGYETTTRSRYQTRQGAVVAVLRVSGGERPEQLAAKFTEGCETDGTEIGLVVDTLKTFKPGRPGEDGMFELAFSPGVRLEPAGGQGRAMVLKKPRLNDDKDPNAFIGVAPNGVEVKVPFSAVAPAELSKVLNERWPELTAPRIKELVQAATQGEATPRSPR